MTRCPWVWLSSLIAVLCGTLAVGCGRDDGGVVAKGMLLDGGAPAVVPDFKDGESCYELEFFPLDASGNLAVAQSYSVTVAQDGSFTVTDRTLKGGIPPGKYRVAVARIGMTRGGDVEDLWQGKFGRQVSPFTCEVQAGKEITIELKGATPAGKPPET